MQCRAFIISGLLWLYLIYYEIAHANLQPGYLDFDNLPDTNFSCIGKVIGGYYADLEANCQMFHVCTIGQLEEPMDIRFLCLNGTVFDQETRVCERVDEVDCVNSEKFYSLNLELYGNTAPALVEAPENKEIITSSTTTTTVAPTTQPPETTTYTNYRPTTIQSSDFVHRTSPKPISSTTNAPRYQQNSHRYQNSQNDFDSSYNPVSYQQNTFNNGAEAHITVTTHTTVYKDQRVPILPTPHSPAPPTTNRNRLFSNKPFRNQNTQDNKQFHTETTKTRSGFPDQTNKEFKFRPTHDNINRSSFSQKNQRNKYDNIFNYKPENDPSDLRYHYFSSPAPPTQYLPQRLSLIRSDSHVEDSEGIGSEDGVDDEVDEDEDDANARKDNIFRVEHPHGHSVQEFGRIEQKPRGFNNDQIKEVASNIYQTASPLNYDRKTDKPHLQLPLPLIPFNSPQPFVLPDHFETKRHQPNDHQLPRVIVSASATISDASGRKLNITLGTISPTLADIIGKPPPTYDDYKEGDEGLDPFYHDVPKIKTPKHKRNVDNSQFNSYDYVNDNYEPSTYKDLQLDKHKSAIYIPLSEEDQKSQSSTIKAKESGHLVLESAEVAIHGIENATKSKYVDNIMWISDNIAVNETDEERFNTETDNVTNEIQQNLTTEEKADELQATEISIVVTKSRETSTQNPLRQPTKKVANLPEKPTHHLASLDIEMPSGNVGDGNVEDVEESIIFTCANQKLHSFYGDRRDCRLFHYCAPGFESSGVLHLKFICDIGTYFNVETQKCTTHKPSRCL